MRGRHATVVAVLVLVTACTPGVQGLPRDPSAPAPLSSSAAKPKPVDCPGPAVRATVGCLRDSLTEFWTATLNRRVVDRIVLAPPRSTVPASCRKALTFHTAFTCPIGNTVYLTHAFTQRLQSAAPRELARYRFAATMSHEMGHVVQFATNDHDTGRGPQSSEQSRAIEQQADCLSGVWAASVGIPDSTFRRAARGVFTIIDSRLERLTHGAPAVREAAIACGQRGRTAKSCHLNVRDVVP